VSLTFICCKFINDHYNLLKVKNHKDSLTGIAISTAVGKAASCGENTIKIHELHDLKDTSNVINIDDERGLVSSLYYL
jgi:WD repeat-containing protein 19